MLKWTKKGTGVQATCSPTSMFCEVTGHDDAQAGLSDISASVGKMSRQANLSDDITKYLSSRYLNPGVNGPRQDLRKLRKF
jgi:hypothetical protein